MSDLHLSPNPPKDRSCEKDWYEVQGRYLDQLCEISGSGTAEAVPVLIAGDVFHDGWRERACPPELINFAIERLPERCYAVPGQHDLPYHRYADKKRSGYWTLVEANKVVDLRPGRPKATGGVVLYGFPWGYEVTPCHQPHDMALNVAVVHSYVYTDKHCYQGAHEERPEGHVSRWEEKLGSYDVAVFGDNHKGFVVEGDPFLINCGTFLRRNLDEREYQPSAWLIYRDGSVRRRPFDCSKDKFLERDDADKPRSDHQDMAEFAESLTRLGVAAVDFEEVTRRLMDREGVREDVREIVTQILSRTKRGDKR